MMEILSSILLMLLFWNDRIPVTRANFRVDTFEKEARKVSEEFQKFADDALGVNFLQVCTIQYIYFLLYVIRCSTVNDNLLTKKLHFLNVFTILKQS